MTIDDYNPMSPNELDTAIQEAQTRLRQLNADVSNQTWELGLMHAAYQRKLMKAAGEK